jgi:mono/diheme cytochrome c family protein
MRTRQSTGITTASSYKSLRRRAVMDGILLLRAAKDLRMRVIHFLAAFSLLPQLSLAQESALEKRGEELLRTECARCHAIGRTGASPNPEAPAFRQLSHKYAIEGLAEALAEGISVGHAEMPEFVFDPDEVAAIIAYLKSIQER